MPRSPLEPGNNWEQLGNDAVSFGKGLKACVKQTKMNRKHYLSGNGLKTGGAQSCVPYPPCLPSRLATIRLLTPLASGRPQTCDGPLFCAQCATFLVGQTQPSYLCMLLHLTGVAFSTWHSSHVIDTFSILQLPKDVHVSFLVGFAHTNRRASMKKHVSGALHGRTMA